LDNLDDLPDDVITYTKIGDLFDTNCIDCTQKVENDEKADPQGLQDYITNHALSDQEQNLSVTYLAYYKGDVVGYFTVAISTLSYDSIPNDERPKTRDEIRKYPALLIANFCTNKIARGKGVGNKMLNHCMGMGALLSEMVGCRYAMLYATTAEEFYSTNNKTPYKFHVVRELDDGRKLMLFRFFNKMERNIILEGGGVSDMVTATVTRPDDKDQEQN
jgi:hypothetical protein